MRHCPASKGEERIYMELFAIYLIGGAALLTAITER
jgi:hypothetical protein